ncbi:MAG: ATP-binding protein [Verrucomicrobia bacterium]|nr:ATP-binding protein [Verrucomicrobiota bacterium]
MLKRHIMKELNAHLNLMPVVLLKGARQAGKTTLVEEFAKERGYSYVTFDDEIPLASALRDPAGWIMSLPKPIIIDEVQRVPEIFLPIKREVDQNRTPGRYLLTGSANPLLSPRLGDSLAGRMGILNLFPFSQGEIQQKNETFLSKIFADSFTNENVDPFSPSALYQTILRGGFPSVQNLSDPKDIKRWVRSYLQTMMERDVRDLSNIEGLRDFPRLLQLLATRSAKLLNVADVARNMGMVTMTLSRYLGLLEALFMIYLLPGWYTNLGKRLIKSPKLHLCDTAIMAQLMDINEARLQGDPSLTGYFLETFVFTELLKQKSWSSIPFELYHFRDGDDEVDFILERPDRTIVGIEVKNARSLNKDDLKGLQHLQKIGKEHFKRGIILHPSDKIEFLGNDLWAVPLQLLWK